MAVLLYMNSFVYCIWDI